jgi:cell division protease FtsH
MEFRRFFRAALLLIAVAALLVFALSRANSGSSYQQVSPSQIVSLINQGQVKSALITDKDQTVQIMTKSGERLEASWNSGQGPQFQKTLQAQLNHGNLPDRYNVSVSGISALIDVLPVAFIFLVISLLFFWHLDYPTEIKRWRAFADRAGQMARRWVQQA